ncbi:MAG: T9SS type A sorting domain-containing protein [Bacteroidales bacterium]|nr:T9SS type A sorting domain-containing protein [Bacteroidales bacterium]MDD4209733.1 T9SS type A sorting domain-containing protein [Bacteroidales bacterium]
MKKCILCLMCSLFMQLNAQEIQLVKNINLSGNANISQMTLFNGKLFFSATDGTNGQELWVSDGTESGTYMFKDINPSGSSNPKELKVCNGKLYFQASLDGGATPKLWVSDGTEAGTIDISNNCHSPQEFTAYNGKVYFAATNNDYGTEFWETDGTKIGTKIVKNIQTVPYDGISSEPACFTVFNNKIYFVAKNNATSFQIYESDGTEAGTIVYSKFPNLGQSTSMKFFVCNGKMFFSAIENNGDYGFFLYVTDSINDVEKLAINGTDFSNPSGFFEWNNQVIFTAFTNDYGNELWISDGSTAGTRMIKDIYPGTESSWAKEFTLYNNKLYFTAADTLSNMELWVSDCTTTGTVKVKEINTNTNNLRQSSPSEFKIFNNKLYFTAKPNLNQVYLFESDGSSTNTFQIDTSITSAYPPNFNPDVQNLFVSEDCLYFLAKYTNTYLMLYKLYIPLEAPVALPSTDLDEKEGTFLAHWSSVAKADYYLLYVSIHPDFYEYWEGYDGLIVYDTFHLVNVVSNCTPYYYKVAAVNAFDTSDFSNIISVQVGGSIDEAKMYGLKFYPSPAKNQLFISLENDIIEKIVIIDINGKTIALQTLDNNQATIDVSYLPAGIYMLKIYLGERSINRKFIKE